MHAKVPPPPTVMARLVARVTAVTARVRKLRPVRVIVQYGEQRGPLLAAGLSYQAVFATFAALWVGFSIAGLYVRTNPELLQAIFDFLSRSVPGLIGTGDQDGAIDPDVLLSASVLGWTGAIALGSLLVTALGWLSAGRDAVRAMFKVGPQQVNFFLVKAKDLGLALAFGLAFVLSAALSVASTSALNWMFSLGGVDEASTAAQVTVRVSGLALVFLFDTVVLASFYRVVSGIAIPFRRLIGGTLVGAAALGVLKALGSALLGGAATNPLLASFAAIVGILIWFNFVSQVILVAATWIAVGMTDRGIYADPRAHDAELAADKAREEQLRQQLLEELTKKRDNWFTRLFTSRR